MNRYSAVIEITSRSEPITSESEIESLLELLQTFSSKLTHPEGESIDPWFIELDDGIAVFGIYELETSYGEEWWFQLDAFFKGQFEVEEGGSYEVYLFDEEVEREPS